MKLINFICACILNVFLNSCTYSITMVHTEGEAMDVVDETATNTPNVSPSLSIPASII